ncbi:YesL family protein [Bifidobacterium miconisargentati]|uniref:YesL family protein n=1 Tax=Bifidobacterium miconisargentati TaxID=2834437 RepID=UPI001BDD07BC|nr:YesL family protein [Bifidobacterium miconisargentati]MBW3091244.1 YesL family protein [Bifidobacterium miconisargentati]
MHWLSPDSKFMRAWGNLVDGVLVNLLMLVTSLPIITVGAALTAGQDACRKSENGEGKGVAANYFNSFKANFVKATLLWLPFLVVLIGLIYSWVVLQITPLLIPKFAVSILWLIGFEWVFALQARFENSVGRTLANAFIFGISHIAMTVVLVAVDAVFVALLVACWFLMPGGLFLLIILGYGTMLMLHVPITERVFKPYLR